MAFGVRPPALAEWIINLGEAAEYMFDRRGRLYVRCASWIIAT